MRGMDKPTGRVVALIVLLIVAAAALRGYLPLHDRAVRAEPGGGRAALTFVVAALAGSLAVVAIAVVARLRDPRAAAPKAGDLSGMLGTGGGRPSWRVLLIGLGVIVAWLLIAMLLVRACAPHDVTSSVPSRSPGAPPPGQATGPPPRQAPRNDGQTTFEILLAATVFMLALLITASVILSRRRGRAGAPAPVLDDHPESPAPVAPAESLARAAEVGLAAMADLSRDPREAIIACYAAMERELATVPGAVPQEFDTPTEVLARAVRLHALRADNAIRLVDLFAEARFSPHVMNEGHRDVAVGVLRLVLDEMRSRSAA
ncbi:DUF4129 domain-containing protein [Mycobacterium bohemicum]|uniref:Protein-glutamine gamma-glutamyltransferase-like C-terminal domain-containing protein n=1 Tax=Mycobacterium bohemicum TaxID=56425 RepID=A0A1X1R1A3_MYCBE|nr:DUF4129 domain-containing protein [Mycobacterium bohemicum]MCV6970232.1 DUF4129 domain-containing protein [Mycobacterium bohemicum]ORU97691.1 hypothetical protein AWB93_17110 [Mycobacterium bohemicum]